MKNKILIFCFCLLLSISLGASFACAEKILAEDAARYFQKGVDAQKTGDFQTALTCYSKAIFIDQSFTPAYNNAGVIYIQISDPGTAEKFFNKAVEVDPQYSLAWQNLAILSAQRNDFDKFFLYWSKATGSDPRSNYLIDTTLPKTKNEDHDRRSRSDW